MQLGSRVDRFGTAAVISLTVFTAFMLAAAWVMNEAAVDLHAQVDIARGQISPGQRAPLGQWLSSPFSSDLVPDDTIAMDTRATDLDHKSDRLAEAVAVVALVGMLVAVVAMRPSGADDLARDATTPLASTSSNGTV